MNAMRRFLLWVGVLLLVNPAPAQPPKPGLFVLSVGVSKYKNPRYNLKYAHKDALDLAEAWRKQTDLYEVREVKTLVNEQATRANIRAALADLKKKVSPTSLLVFVFSGHGLNDALVTHEFDNDDRTATTLGRADLTAQLSALGGNYIALIDACHSGSFAKNFSGGKDISTESRAEQDAAISSMLRALSAPDKANIVIGSSSSSEKSDECDACQNGYFTQCLLDAFEGKAVVDGRRTIRPDVDGNGFVETNELDAYIKEAVFYATRTNQFPQNVLAQQTIGYNFSIVRPSNSTGAGKPLVYDNSRTAETNSPRTESATSKSVAFRATNLTGDDAKDSDLDGIPDLFDLCRDQMGESRFWGCLTDPEPTGKWSQFSNGVIPTGAVSLGATPDGKVRYLVRANRWLGYIESGSQTAKIFTLRGIVELNTYDILHKGKFSWQGTGESLNPLANNRFTPVRLKGFRVAIVRTTRNNEPIAGIQNGGDGRFFTGEPEVYKSKTYQVLMDDEAETARLSVSAHQSVSYLPFYLFINDQQLNEQGARKAFSFPAIRPGKVSLKAKYMVLKPKGVFGNKYDTLWRTTEPLQLDLQTGQTYTLLLGRAWQDYQNSTVVLTDAINQNQFRQPAAPPPANLGGAVPNSTASPEPSAPPERPAFSGTWTKVRFGQIPSFGVQGGHEANGTPLYVVRADYEGGLHIGKARPGDLKASISYGGQEVWVAPYSVLISPGRWVQVVSNRIPANAVQAGQEASGSPLYIARAKLGDGVHVGKASPNQGAYIPYDGREVHVTTFEVFINDN